jgi:hypothetical protein
MVFCKRDCDVLKAVNRHQNLSVYWNIDILTPQSIFECQKKNIFSVSFFFVSKSDFLQFENFARFQNCIAGHLN